jgi:GntR family transcriptional repressor for pyruvate dehydrogenase complex
VAREHTAAAAPAPVALRPGFRRIAEQVADHLRTRILHGDLADGDLLPKEEELRDGYEVSKSSFREAMRILEAEGLISVRRGNVGGAVVHRPSPGNVAYTLAVVLSARAVTIDDVARALREVEPACAALCAARSDRAETVVPALRAVHASGVAKVGDLVEATRWSRRFHETLVSVCGNETLIVMVGALETLWSSHETGWAEAHTHPASLPVEERRRAFDSHYQLIELISRGEVETVRELAVRHLGEVQGYPGSPIAMMVRSDLAREQRITRTGGASRH